MTEYSSETTGAIDKALSIAQSKMQNPEKNCINPHFKSPYSDLASGLDAVRGPLSSVGISLSQTEFMDGNTLMLRTRLGHESGEWIASVTPVIQFPCKMHDRGAAMTYARRFSLFSICGIAGDTPDDDGNEASKQQTQAPKRALPPEKPRYTADMPPEQPQMMTEEESAQSRINLLAKLHDAKTREDLKAILVSSTAERARMWEDDKEVFKVCFRAAEDKISEANNGASNG